MNRFQVPSLRGVCSDSRFPDTTPNLIKKKIARNEPKNEMQRIRMKMNPFIQNAKAHSQRFIV